MADRIQRYVAMGDSSTEGLDDPDAAGGYRGWANRLAEQVAAAQGGLLYANLAVRGRTTPEVRREQLEAALALEPDLVTLFSGTNDVLRRDFDALRLERDFDHMFGALRTRGAIVLTITLPDLSPVLPLARPLRSRVAALNRGVRASAGRHGVRVADLAEQSVTSDPRLWSPDRLHANSRGHARIAAALAQALGLPGSSDAWAQPLSGADIRSGADRWSEELQWIWRYLLPWLWRHAQGRSSGDRRRPKRPSLEPVREYGLGPSGP